MYNKRRNYILTTTKGMEVHMLCISAKLKSIQALKTQTYAILVYCFFIGAFNRTDGMHFSKQYTYIIKHKENRDAPMYTSWR